jgi:hypothetical protein
VIEYRGYQIARDPPPIPSRAFDWQFAADGYDGAIDSSDIRCGSGPDAKDCMEQIDEIEELLTERKLSLKGN